MADGGLRVAIIGEDEAHRVLCEYLADGVCGGLEGLGDRRRFLRDRDRGYFKLGKRPPVPRGPGGRPAYSSQRSRGRPAGYAGVLFDAVREVRAEVDVILVLADEDGERDRMEAPARCAEHFRQSPETVVVGVCNPVAEAWFVALVAPGRQRRAQELRAQLGQPVVAQPELLCSKPLDAKRHAKRALRFLLEEETEVVACKATTLKAHELRDALQGGPLDVEWARAFAGCGLGEFVARLQEHYLPRVSERGSPA